MTPDEAVREHIAELAERQLVSTAPCFVAVLESLDDDRDEMCHVVCCDDDVALCGKNVQDEKWDPLPRFECVVCLDLECAPCPKCGCEA